MNKTQDIAAGVRPSLTKQKLCLFDLSATTVSYKQTKYSVGDKGVIREDVLAGLAVLIQWEFVGGVYA